MLHHTRPVQPKQIHQRNRRLTLYLQMHRPSISLIDLMQDCTIETRDQKRQESNRRSTSLRRVGRVVDVVWRDIGEIRVGGVLLHVELVDEVVEDGGLNVW